MTNQLEQPDRKRRYLSLGHVLAYVTGVVISMVIARSSYSNLILYELKTPPWLLIVIGGVVVLFLSTAFAFAFARMPCGAIAALLTPIVIERLFFEFLLFLIGCWGILGYAKFITARFDVSNGRAIVIAACLYDIEACQVYSAMVEVNGKREKLGNKIDCIVGRNSPRYRVEPTENVEMFLVVKETESEHRSPYKAVVDFRTNEVITRIDFEERLDLQALIPSSWL